MQLLQKMCALTILFFFHRRSLLSTSVKQYESSITRLPDVGEKDRLLAGAIGARIREFCKQLKMTVAEVSNQAGLSQCLPA